MGVPSVTRSSRSTRLPAAIRIVHPAPTAAVVTLATALALVIGEQAGGAEPWRVACVGLTVLGSQIATGALNDWADHRRDERARPEKPIPAGEIDRRGALGVVAVGVALQLAASLALGWLPTLLGLVALGSAVVYDLGLSRTPLSPLPYLVSFGVLPLWIAAGVGVDLGRVLPAVPLVAPFATAAHLANTLRDWEADAADGSRSLAQTLGRARSHALAVVMAVAVGVIVALIFVAGGRLGPASAILGVAGLVAVAQGARDARRLWYGILFAAVCWTIAWALATG